MRGIEFHRRAVFTMHTLNNLNTHECSRARKVWEQAMGYRLAAIQLQV